MPEGQAVAAAGAAQQPQQQGTTWAVVKGFLFRMAIIYFVSSLIRGWRQQPASPGSNGNQSDQLGAPGGSGYRPSQNLFARGTEMDLYVYISENHRFRDFDDSKALFWMLPNVVYGDWKGGLNGDGTFTKDGEIQCTENLQNNGSIYMHVYFVKAGKSPDPQSVDYERQGTVYSSRRLNKYKKKRYRKTQNLLTGKTETNEEELKKIDLGVKAEILSHWHPNLTLNLVDDHTNWVKGSLPPPLDEHVQFDEATGDYYPIVFFNDYWNLMSDYQPINETTQMLNLSVTFAPTSLFKWQLYVSQTMRNRWMSVLGSDIAEESDEDQDSLKQAILDTNPYLLGATIAVSILHTIFEFLAFKNDIQFWRNRKSLEGLSVRSVLFNVFTSLIVLLYIMDNETNFVVRISIGIGLLIELWKVPKVLDIKIDREHKWFGVIPRVRFQDKGSYVESSTKIYDQMAFKYLAWALFPLLGGYAVYSLIYNEHRSWYSFVLSMMYGFLLTFGKIFYI